MYFIVTLRLRDNVKKMFEFQLIGVWATIWEAFTTVACRNQKIWLFFILKNHQQCQISIWKFATNSIKKKMHATWLALKLAKVVFFFIFIHFYILLYQLLPFFSFWIEKQSMKPAHIKRELEIFCRLVTKRIIYVIKFSKMIEKPMYSYNKKIFEW